MGMEVPPDNNKTDAPFGYSMQTLAAWAPAPAAPLQDGMASVWVESAASSGPPFAVKSSIEQI